MASLAARDIRSSLGANLSLLKKETGLDPWVVSPLQLKQALMKSEQVEVPESDHWRLPYLQQLLSQKLQAYYQGNQEEEERLKGLINSLVVN